MQSLSFLPALAACALLAAAPASAKVHEAIKGESSITYRIRNALHKVTSVSKDVTCTVDLAEDTVSSKVSVSVPAKSFDSGNSNRDDHALEAIKAHKHPNVSFASDSVSKAPDGWLIHGKLTFAGQTRPVEFKVTPKKEPGKVRIVGDFSVKLTDFGIKRPSLMFIVMEDKLDIRFDLVAKDE